MNHIVKLASWYLKRSSFVKALTTAFISATIFYLGSILEQHAQGIASEQSLSAQSVRTIFIFIVVVIVMAVYFFFSRIVKDLELESTKRKEMFSYSLSLLDQLISEKIDLASDPDQHQYNCRECTERIVKKCNDQIQNLVELLFQLFESQYGESHLVDTRVEFEVTFMTLSYMDNKLTIPASANRHGRSPISMLRRKVNHDVYSDTISARIYSSGYPETCLIEDAAEDKDYKEIYKGQKKRIRSSIVFPVRSSKNELLGTLVVHCDKPKFFRKSDIHVWNELLEVYSKRIALEKTILDGINATNQLGIPAPF